MYWEAKLHNTFIFLIGNKIKQGFYTHLKSSSYTIFASSSFKDFSAKQYNNCFQCFGILLQQRKSTALWDT